MTCFNVPQRHRVRCRRNTCNVSLSEIWVSNLLISRIPGFMTWILGAFCKQLYSLCPVQVHYDSRLIRELELIFCDILYINRLSHLAAGVIFTVLSIFPPEWLLYLCGNKKFCIRLWIFSATIFLQDIDSLVDCLYCSQMHYWGSFGILQRACFILVYYVQYLDFSRLLHLYLIFMFICSSLAGAPRSVWCKNQDLRWLNSSGRKRRIREK